MEHTETLIVEQLKTGNEDAYQYIYDRHYALLCHVANGYVKDHFLAETIVGDTIFHLWEIRETLEISVSIRSYLLRAVRNRCINYLNSEWEKREISFSSLMPDEITDDKMMISDSHPLGTLLERELEEEIYKAIDKLPDECRRVFDKSRFEGKSYEEISQELGISVNTVKYHIKNALASLQKNLSKYLITLLLFFFG
ncbi:MULTISPECIES: RNA polymerase sigma-70 factor [Bacteroides]|jgi:RNA polymerase sigma-70 factor (ECF subfamily)|uniref:RNA polymerase sigma-70 factor n=1 Tax=Bacteroides TaxID=816 RepID=UPI0008225127|nr:MULTISPECIES: RNA polymerase sigma-70 factor [Bacteroides]SCI24772.1 Sigma-24 [uncultured Bacteroides sp.]